MESEEKNTTVEEEEDDEEGPPPGFQCIVVPQQKETMETDLNEEEEEEVDADADADDDDVDSDGPPPGWSPIPQPVPKIQTSGEMGPFFFIAFFFYVISSCVFSFFGLKKSCLVSGIGIFSIHWFCRHTSYCSIMVLIGNYQCLRCQSWER